MSREKFKALVHFIISECEDSPHTLGAIRLNKALWLTDVTAYKANGVSVTGEPYVKRPKGPVPKHILATLRELQDDGALLIKEPEFVYDTRKFIPLRSPASDHLSGDEREIAKAVLEYVCGKTANQISEETHDSVWEEAREGEEIPLAATLVAQEGAYTPEMFEWANNQVVEIVKEIKGAAA